MELAALTEGIDARPSGDGAAEITDLAYDSRKVGPGALFFCVSGMTVDGHRFARQAVDSGAAALVVERELEIEVPQILVDDCRAAMAPLAARFFGHPTEQLDLLAVTGTNGKTTTTFLLRAILEASGRPCGMLGTVKQVVGGVAEEVERTTPEAIDLQRTLRRMVDAGDRACAIEISSHALALGRTDHLTVRSAGFTNLTQDHLDFHSDMDDYFTAKRLLFEPTDGRREPPGAAAINVDDRYGAMLAKSLREAATIGRLITFSASGAEADLSAGSVDFDSTGASFVLAHEGEELAVEVGLPGAFNVENALAALSISLGTGIELREAVAALAAAEPVPGRMEPVDAGQPFPVLVDYAHTPEALDNVLRAARRLTEGRLICVFGCGGDRDRAKRPLMGRVAAELSDLAILTSDNPRSEQPGAIIDDVLEGIERRERVSVEADRRAAIALAVAEAERGDLIVVAGKGHEQGQEFAEGRKEPFDDREVVGRILATAQPGGLAR